MTSRIRVHDDGVLPRAGWLGFLARPFVLAGRVFRPGRAGRLTDQRMEAAQVARTAIAFAAAAWLLYSYPLRGSAEDFAQDEFVKALLSAALLLSASPLALVMFILATRPPRRSAYLRRFGGPLVAFGVLLCVTAFNWALWQEGMEPAWARQLPWGLGLVTLLVLLAAMLFSLPFFLAALVLSVHHTFRMADVHEVLPRSFLPCSSGRCSSSNSSTVPRSTHPRGCACSSWSALRCP